MKRLTGKYLLKELDIRNKQLTDTIESPEYALFELLLEAYDNDEAKAMSFAANLYSTNAIYKAQQLVSYLPTPDKDLKYLILKQLSILYQKYDKKENCH